MTKFSETLKCLRLSRGITQEELAKVLGVSPSTIGMYEAGKRQPNFEMEEKIADYFNVSLDALRGMPALSTFEAAWNLAIKKDDNKTLKAIIDESKSMSETKLQQILSYIKFLKQEG